MKVTKAKTLFIWASRFGYKGSACPRHALDKPHTCCDFFATRLAAHRRRQGKLRSNDRIALGPRGRRRGAQGFGAARDSALRLLTSRRLFERSERSERSEFGAGPEHRAPQSSPAPAGPPPSGSPFLGYFFWRSKRSNSPAGANSRQQPHAVNSSTILDPRLRGDDTAARPKPAAPDQPTPKNPKQPPPG